MTRTPFATLAALALAASLGVAGCAGAPGATALYRAPAATGGNAPNQAVAPAANHQPAAPAANQGAAPSASQTAAAVRLAGQSLVSDAGSAMEAELDLDAGEIALDDAVAGGAAGYRTLALVGRMARPLAKMAPAKRVKVERALLKVKAFSPATRLQLARSNALRRAAVKARLVGLKGAFDATRSFEVLTDEEAGTSTASGSFQLNGKDGFLVHTLERTTDKEGTLLHAEHDLSARRMNGTTVKAHREREANDAGGYSDTFTSEIVRKDGTTRTVKWVRESKADGSSVSDGTLTRFDGSVVTIHITRSAEGKVVATMSDTGRKVEAEVSKDELAPGGEVKISDGSNGQVVEVAPVADVTALAGDAK